MPTNKPKSLSPEELAKQQGIKESLGDLKNQADMQALGQSQQDDKLHEQIKKEEKEARLFFHNSHGERESYWKKVGEKARRLTSPGESNTTYEWTTHAAQYWEMIHDLAHVLRLEWGNRGLINVAQGLFSNTIGVLYGETLGRTEIGQQFAEGVKQVVDKASRLDGIRDVLDKKPYRRAEMEYIIQVDHKGALDTNWIMNGQKLTDKNQTEPLDTALIAWLENHGYTFDSETRIAIDKQGNKLTTTAVANLENNPKTCLTNYMNKQYGFEAQSLLKEEAKEETDLSAPSGISPYYR